MARKLRKPKKERESPRSNWNEEKGTFYCRITEDHRTVASCALGFCGTHPKCPHYRAKESKGWLSDWHQRTGKPPLNGGNYWLEPTSDGRLRMRFRKVVSPVLPDTSEEIPKPVTTSKVKQPQKKHLNPLRSGEDALDLIFPNRVKSGTSTPPSEKAKKPRKVKSKEEEEAPVPKKRGRPRKVKVESVDLPKKRRGRPKKVVVGTSPPPKKRRGRPPKVKTEEPVPPKKKQSRSPRVKINHTGLRVTGTPRIMKKRGRPRKTPVEVPEQVEVKRKPGRPRKVQP